MELSKILDSLKELENKETIKISYYIIKYCKDKNIDITNLKLLKLLYFCNIEYQLENNGRPMFSEKFLAWRHGPVLQSVYNYFCMGIVLPAEDKINFVFSEIPSDKKKVLDKVLKIKANKPTWELVEETHIANGPWINVYNGNKDNNGICQAEIDYEDIYKFYKDYGNVSNI